MGSRAMMSTAALTNEVRQRKRGGERELRNAYATTCGQATVNGMAVHSVPSLDKYHLFAARDAAIAAGSQPLFGRFL